MGIFDAFVNLGLGINNQAQQERFNEQQIALARELNESQLRYATETRDLQWMRDDSAMQRRVSDLKAAGLNPVIAAGVGGAANSQPLGYNGHLPSNMRAPQMSSLSGIDDAVINGVRVAQSVVDMDRARNEMRNSTAITNAQVDALQSQAEKNRSDTLFIESRLLTEEVNRRLMEAGITGKDVETAKKLIEQDILEEQRSYIRDHGSTMPVTPKIESLVDSAIKQFSGANSISGYFDTLRRQWNDVKNAPRGQRLRTFIFGKQSGSGRNMSKVH